MVRVVAQRVTAASVSVAGETVGAINRGLLLLVGIHENDDERDVDRVAGKVAVMRIFEDDTGKMNLSAVDVGGAILAISQFTLFADLRKGRRPSFIQAATPEVGQRMYDRFCASLEEQGYHVERGRFGAHMSVTLVNDGPVTIILDSGEL